MKKSVSIIVKGKVQGVFYRQSTRAFARAAGINGEIKNNPDGTVSVLATGSASQIEKLIEWCRKGPERAVVTGIVVEEIAVRDSDSFQIIK